MQTPNLEALVSKMTTTVKSGGSLTEEEVNCFRTMLSEHNSRAKSLISFPWELSQSQSSRFDPRACGIGLPPLTQRY